MCFISKIFRRKKKIENLNKFKTEKTEKNIFFFIVVVVACDLKEQKRMNENVNDFCYRTRRPGLN